MKLKIRSRHPSIESLRNNIKVPVKAVWRHGSTTSSDVKHEINNIESVQNSSSKLLMKKCFTKAGVKTAEWWVKNPNTGNISKVIGVDDNNELLYQVEDLPFPIVAKGIFGSRGTSNYLLNTQEEFDVWAKTKNIDKYIFEKFSTMTTEYRFHVTEKGCFYACRKLLKADAEKTWCRNGENAVWIVETNPSFDKPVNYDEIIGDCVKALKELGGDVFCFDVKMQSSKDKKGKLRERREFILLESNSAPSLAEIGLDKYSEILPQILKDKYKL